MATDDFHPGETSPEDDYKKNEFLDLSKPLIRQVWESNFSKEFYLQQIHQPRHIAKAARFFGPDYLEVRWIIGLADSLQRWPTESILA